MNRRDLLQRLGAAAALAPFVPVTSAEAASGPIRRLLLVFTPHGTVRDAWRPSGGEKDFVLSSILAPLERHREHLVVLDGLRIDDASVGAPHTKGSPLLWTASPLIEDQTFSRDDGNGVYYYGWNSGPSIDQAIAEALQPPTPWRSLELGVRPGANHPGHRTIYRGAEQPLAPEDDPYAAFAALFGGGASEVELERRYAQRRSVLDQVHRELSALSGKLSVDDRIKLDAHAEAVRDLERTLVVPEACEGPELPPGIVAARMSDVPHILDAHLDLITSAFRCDLTRIASLQLAVAENDHTIYDWVGVDQEIHHLITHSTTPADQADLTTIYTWYAEKLASLMDRLAAVQEGEGTLLDHTLIVWGSEIGRGWDHRFDNVPFVLAGGAGGAWPTGRFLQFAQTKHNRLLVSVARAMGVPLDRFGGTDDGVGGLAGLI